MRRFFYRLDYTRHPEAWMFDSETLTFTDEERHLDALLYLFDTAAYVSSPHQLRHHCASALISSGCSIKAVQQFLGHKNASETLDVYGHLMPGDDDRVRAAIDASLSGNVHEMCTPGPSAVAE